MEEEDIEIIVDIETLALCRLCISNKGKFQIVKQMQRNLKECFDISIHSYDGMSQIICEICKKLVTEIVEVRERFKKNQEILTQKRQKLVTDDEKTLPVISESVPELNGDSKKDEPSAEIKVKEIVKVIVQKEIKNLQKNTPSESPITISLDSESGGSSKESSNKTKHNRSKRLFSDSEDSDGDNIKLNSLRNSFKYVCRVCDDSFNTKTKMKSHIRNEHSRLYKSVVSQCTPCSVLLRHASFGNQKPDEWVRLKPSKILKFTPSDPLYYLVKCGKPKVIDSSSSDSDSSVSKTNSYRRIVNKPKAKVIADKYAEKLDNSAKNLLQEVRTKASKLSLKMTSSNSDKITPRDTVMSYPTVCVNSDSDSLPAPEVVPDKGVTYKMALTEEDISRVIESCLRIIKNKKSLTAPIKKDWLIRDVIEYNVINTVWINSDSFKVSRITSAVKQTENDKVSQLPLYRAEKTSGSLGHRKLEKAPPPPPPEQKTNPQASVKANVKEQRPLASKTPPTVPPLKAVKRSMPSLDDIPAKKVATDVQEMNPIIVSTVSLAKTCEPSTVGQPPANNKPVIKCKPTSLLMPSPVKENVNTTIYNQHNVNQPDTVPGPVSGLSQQNGLLSSIENNQNNVSSSLNFDGINMTLNNGQNANILLMNSSQQQSAPQVLNNSLMGPVETQPLLSSGNLYQNDQSQIYMTAAEAAQQSLYQYSSVNGAPGSEYVDINAQLSLPNIHIPEKASIVTQLIQRCKRENVTLKTSLSVPTKYCKLLRFVLTIKEKQCETRILVSSEFIVEVCMQIDGVFVLNVSDHSKAIDLTEWSNEFQSELINALKKPEFVETMRKVGKNFAFAQNVYLFANTLEKFQVDYALLNP